MSLHDDIKTEELLEEKIRESRPIPQKRVFKRCSGCGRVFWHDGRLCDDCAKKEVKP